MRTFVLTAIGEDRAGLVTALAALVEEHGGSWVDSQLSLLAGKFAGIVQVDVPAERAEAFEQALPGLEQQVGLRVEAEPVGPAGDPGASGAPFQLHLLGTDRPGMVHDVAQVLSEHGATIEQLTSQRRDAPEGGGVLFEADAVVRLGAAEDAEEAVRSSLEDIAAELMVDLDLAPEGSEG